MNNNNEELTVNDLINDIKSNIKQASASNRDEVRVMRAMLNDTSFMVSTYSNTGVEQHCPAQNFRNMLSNIVSSTTNISKAEATNLVENYECKKSDAETMISISKDFINTTLRTGRKIALGGTEKSNISLQLKEVPTTTKSYPTKVVHDNGDIEYIKSQKTVLGHETLKISAPCPSWVTE